MNCRCIQERGAREWGATCGGGSCGGGVCVRLLLLALLDDAGRHEARQLGAWRLLRLLRIRDAAYELNHQLNQDMPNPVVHNPLCDMP
jgi:hypothetical protein